LKKVAIIQSNYIPWKGYFDFINDVDEFIFLDNVQFTPRDWRTRNKIKTINGSLWLTVPVGSDRNRAISEVAIVDKTWQAKHWKTIIQFYSKAPCFKMFKDFLEFFYMEMKHDNLSQMNQFLIKKISNDFLGSRTIFKNDYEYKPVGNKFDLIMDLVIKSGADVYISGPAARNYMDEEVFKKKTSAGLIWKDYSGYPEYNQLYKPFEHAVTVLDLLFNTGPDASYYIWGWRQPKA